LSSDAHRGLYDALYLDSRSGLPNMASFTRVLADQAVGREALHNLPDALTLEAQRADSELYDKLARKRRYYEQLMGSTLAPVDAHRVLLRRHEPERGRASFRVELTKLTGWGGYVRVAIDLTQTSGAWSNQIIELDAEGAVVRGTEGLQGVVYRFADYDAETLFVRLHDLDGVEVERVQRGIVGPVLFSIESEGAAVHVAEPQPGGLTDVWRRGLESPAVDPSASQWLASFATDVAARDVPVDKSNDPLSPLLARGIRQSEAARYRILRERHPFCVYKDRKFVASAALVPLVQAFCAAAGTKNLVYRV
jgi:hypothetical protein